jgi:Protein of unknown function (DUF2630)
MDNPQIHGAIEELVAEEHELWQRESAGEASKAARRRLEEIRISLDQCWDLLRQRRARRDAGQDPDTAATRASEVVDLRRRPEEGPDPSERGAVREPHPEGGFGQLDKTRPRPRRHVLDIKEANGGEGNRGDEEPSPRFH